MAEETAEKPKERKSKMSWLSGLFKSKKIVGVPPLTAAQIEAYEAENKESMAWFNTLLSKDLVKYINKKLKKEMACAPNKKEYKVSLNDHRYLSEIKSPGDIEELIAPYYKAAGWKNVCCVYNAATGYVHRITLIRD